MNATYIIGGPVPEVRYCNHCGNLQVRGILAWFCLSPDTCVAQRDEDSRWGPDYMMDAAVEEDLDYFDYISGGSIFGDR